jgi:hypothetical protein
MRKKKTTTTINGQVKAQTWRFVAFFIGTFRLGSHGLSPSSALIHRSAWKGSFSEVSAWIILTTHPCSSSGPMAQPVLAGTLSISELRRSDS